MFVVGKEDPTRIVFSDLGDFKSYASTSFIYVPSPKSGDPITALAEYQSYLVIFTLETKHMLYGASPAEFSLRQTMATKGAWAQECVAADRNYLYFLADNGIYRSNTASDELLSDKVKPKIAAMINPMDLACLVLWRNQIRLYFAEAPNAVMSSCLVYDFFYKQFFYDTDTYVSRAVVKSQEDDSLIEFSNLVGAAYIAETQSSNLGKPIYFKYWTNYRRYTSGAQLHRIKKFKPILRAVGLPFYLNVGRDKDFANRPTVKPYLVKGTGATWGDGVATWGDGVTVWGGARLVDNSKSFSGRSKYSQFRFEREGVETDVQLSGYIIIFVSGRIRG